MLWLIFTLWALFAIVCGILTEIVDEEIFGFLFFVSIPIIFYVPMFLK